MRDENRLDFTSSLVPHPWERSDMSLLEVRDLSVEFRLQGGTARALDGVSLEVRPGEMLGVVGESGSGKSVTALSVMRLLPSPPGRVVGGQILFEGRELRTMPEPEQRAPLGGAV